MLWAGSNQGTARLGASPWCWWDALGRWLGGFFYSGLAGVCCLASWSCCTRRVLLAVRASPVCVCVCVHCAGINQTHNGGSSLLQLFYLTTDSPTFVFSYLFLLTAHISRYNRVFFLRTPGFHLISLRQLFLPLIFPISLSNMTMCISPSHLHGWEIKNLACECFHPLDSLTEQYPGSC